MKKTAVILINLVVAIAAAQMPIRGSFKLIDPPEYSIDTMTVKLVGVDANGVSGILDYPTLQSDLQGVLDAGSSAEDQTITLTNSGSSLYSLTAYDRFQIGNFTIFRLGEIRHQNPSLNTHITLRFENPVDESVVTVPNQNGTMVLKNATNNIVELFDDTSLRTPQLIVKNIGSGDAGVGFSTGSTGYNYTVGVDNSDSDKFTISAAYGTQPNIGANNVFEIGPTINYSFALEDVGAGIFTNENWYNAITANNGFKSQTNNLNFGQLTHEYLLLSSGSNYLKLDKVNGIVSTLGNSKITISLNNGAEGIYLLPDLGDGSNEDVIVTQTTQTVKQAKVTIPSNELKNCSSNPVTIIPAQGARTVINILNATAYLEYGSEAYSFDGIVYLRIGNNPSFTLDETDLNVIANNYMTFFAPTQSSSSANNSAVVLTSGSDSATGDSPVTIVVTYTVDNYN